MIQSKNMKVYRVTFYEFIKFGKNSGDFTDVKKFNVLAENVGDAMYSAKEFITKKEAKTLYVGEVELLTILD